MNEVPRELRSAGEKTVSRQERKNLEIIQATAGRIQSEIAEGIVDAWTHDPEAAVPQAADVHDAFEGSLKQLQRAIETTRSESEQSDLCAQVTVLIDDYMRDIKPKAQIKSCIALSQAFLLRGMLSYILGDYAAASADAAAIYYSMNRLCPCEPIPNVVAALLLKGQAEYMRGDLATAKEDLRACCAYKCELGEELFKTNEVRWLLGVMATEKAGTPRPHYSDHERHEICRALQLEHYSSKCMTCAVCQQPPSADVRLKLCKQCQQRWYCSRECQKRHWPKHKRGCSPILPNMQVIIMHTVEAKYKAAIDARGFAFTEHKTPGRRRSASIPRRATCFRASRTRTSRFTIRTREETPSRARRSAR